MSEGCFVCDCNEEGIIRLVIPSSLGSNLSSADAISGWDRLLGGWG